jgi:hypothetical protein
VRGQRSKHQDPGDPRIRVELGDPADDLAQGCVGRELFRPGVDPQLPRVATDSTLVDLSGEVVTDQQRRDAGAVRQGAQLPQQRPAQLFGKCPSVDQHASGTLKRTGHRLERATASTDPVSRTTTAAGTTHQAATLVWLTTAVSPNAITTPTAIRQSSPTTKS